MASVVETVKVIDVAVHAEILPSATVALPPLIKLMQPVPAPPVQFARLPALTVPKFVPVIVIESPLRAPSLPVVVETDVASGAPAGDAIV